MKRFLVMMLATLSGCGWTRAEIGRQAAFGALMVADAHQTQTFVNECRELNPIIGECGERVPLATYFLGTMFLHTVVTHVIPRKYRAAFQWFSIGVQSATVVQNIWVK